MAANCKVYVGNLSNQIYESDVNWLFGHYGKVAKVELKAGFGFIEYDDPRDAEDAIEKLNGYEFGNQKIVVESCKGPNPDRRPGGPGRAGARVVVEGLDDRTSWQDLKDFARKSGNVLFTMVHRNDRTGERLGFVEFASQDDVEKALRELDGSELSGRNVRVREATEQDEDTLGEARQQQRFPPRGGGGPPPRDRGGYPSRDRSPPRHRGGGGGDWGPPRAPPPALRNPEAGGYYPSNRDDSDRGGRPRDEPPRGRYDGGYDRGPPSRGPPPQYERPYGGPPGRERSPPRREAGGYYPQDRRGPPPGAGGGYGDGPRGPPRGGPGGYGPPQRGGYDDRRGGPPPDRY